MAWLYITTHYSSRKSLEASGWIMIKGPYYITHEYHGLVATFVRYE